MALTRNDTLSQLSAGWLRGRYFLRDLMGQILIFLAVALVMVGYVFYQWYQSIPADQLNYLWWYWKAYIWGIVLVLPEHHVVLQEAGEVIRLQAQQVLRSHQMIEFVDAYNGFFEQDLKAALPWGLGAWTVLAGLFYWGGKRQRDNELLEGVQQIPLSTYHRYLKKHKLKSMIKLGNAFWTKNAEKQHLLIVGDTGAGKSQLLIQLLRYIRKLGDQVVLYDPKGDMVRDFYQPDLDVLYSPFDTRSPIWNVWQDLNTEQALETFAEAVIKESPGKDSFWAKTARMVLVSALKQGRKEGLSFVQSIHKLVSSDLDTLTEWLDGSEVASDFSNSKTAATILSELKSQARALKYLADDKQASQASFAIESFFTECFEKMDSGDRQPMPWLFLPVQKKYKASARPIMAAQIELISNFILSQPTNRHRRIWFIIDELPSLGKLSALPELLAEGRGYGVATVLALQNFSQLLKHYGKDDAHNLAGQCASLVALRTSDPQTADYLSKRFGKQIRKEVQTNQSLSKGKTGSFSQGHSEHIAERAAVSETDLSSLPDLKAFFKANGVPNPVKIDIAITQMEPSNPPHCPIEELRLSDAVDATSGDEDGINETCDPIATDAASTDSSKIVSSQPEAPQPSKPTVITWDI
ncbi:type IV conjugative transfer system coupling protein TraD [Thiomicrorhabdus immobilis]|uniref:Type IV conjugative transfer system coupling protein TraD n=1 Tax=Thiomicrorhabdus immobilis TaxID=2791037 RepID=A0ABM7MBK8_9GAMM|nr:type IV secretion system DNA-binding domain-containing protein [Thiomicrorhabdus immobilis]BCN92776.1 type IV conjugative transfer system coupling protein TraD [Thiomicrorhabdus immobilis]